MFQLFLIAARNLAQHRRRTILLGGAIAGVTALLVILTGLTSGIRDTMIRSATTLMTGHINVAGFYKVTSGQSAPVVTDYKKVLEVVKAEVPELDYVIDRGRGWGKIIGDGGSIQVGIAGIDVATELGFKEVVRIKEGRLEDLAQPATILVFEEQAKKLEVGVGDSVTVSTSTSRGVANTMDLRVVAVAHSIGLFSQFSVYIPSQSLRELYQINEETTGALHLYLKDLTQLSAVRARLRTSLEAAGYQLMEPNPQAFWMKFETVNREAWTGQKLDLTTWDEEISFMTWTLQTLQAMSVLLISILVVIIVVGIMNTMWIAIRERTREIGTLRAIGMQRPRVLMMFLIEAGLLGLFGTVGGALVGLAAAMGLNAAGITVPEAAQLFLMTDTLSFAISPVSALVAVFIITGVTTLAALYPAFRAGRLKPVTAMHHIG